MGHTMAIHSRNEEVILQFGLKKPAFRIVVNTPTSHGSIGLTTGLDPALTLGCGGFGGNITSDNIAPRHLLNIKRLAYEVRPAVRAKTGSGSIFVDRSPDENRTRPHLPAGISADALSRRVDDFLATRGFRTAAAPVTAPPAGGSPDPLPAAAAEPVSEFVCEEDVRQAVRAGRKITIGGRTIVTPAARDLGEQHGIFVQTAFRTP
jgi:acetaldehyde dehydrogenase (acetylating)